ncbi:MAG: hypothetical protein GNW80_03350 [Asgard group archaeon]|nr:hypothetical protein [Asgard group archaeon]
MIAVSSSVAPALFNWWTPRCELGCPEKCGNPVSNEIEECTIITGKTIEYLPKDKRD